MSRPLYLVHHDTATTMLPYRLVLAERRAGISSSFALILFKSLLTRTIVINSDFFFYFFSVLSKES